VATLAPDEAVAALEAAADPDRLPGMARVGINVSHALGVSVPSIRRIAKRAGTDHALAKALWSTDIHEARMLAALVADPSAFSFSAMRTWARDLDSWDVTDMLADPLVATPHADRAIRTWSTARHGFTKRCAFSMLARLAVGHPDEPDATYLAYLPLIRDAATDDRNEVKKAVNWALRQIGKRNRALHAAAITEAEALLEIDDRTATWIARDALRELRSPATAARIPR
jgi:3-methyladenine DNA glycosylase AlkD